MLSLTNSQDVLRETAAMCRGYRLDLGWRQADLAERSGVSVATVRRFERKGAIGFHQLARILVSLRIADDFLNAFKPGAPRYESVEEFMARAEKATRRQRGRRVSKG